MNIIEYPMSANPTQAGIDLAKKVVDNILGQRDDMGCLSAVSAKNLGYHAHFKFDGVEMSQAYYLVDSVNENPDMDGASSVLRSVLAKVELGQGLSDDEVLVFKSPMLNLCLQDTQDGFCFSLESLCMSTGGPDVRIDCKDMENDEPSGLDLTFHWR